jgi:hypothetical protein
MALSLVSLVSICWLLLHMVEEALAYLDNLWNETGLHIQSFCSSCCFENTQVSPEGLILKTGLLQCSLSTWDLRPIV